MLATLGFSVSFAKIFSRELKCAHPSYQLVESKEFFLYLCVLCKVRCDSEKSLPGFLSRAFGSHCVCCLDAFGNVEKGRRKAACWVLPQGK